MIEDRAPAVSRHRTYWTPIGGGKIRCRCWACSWEVEMDLDETTGEIKKWTGPDGKPKAGGFPFQRISHENEIEEALAAGIKGEELFRIAQQYVGGHHFCANRKCDGTGDGSCGIQLRSIEVTHCKKCTEG